MKRSSIHSTSTTIAAGAERRPGREHGLAGVLRSVLAVAKVNIGATAALEANSTLKCNWGGVIQITAAGQTKTTDT
jgi:hypothetical protein